MCARIAALLLMVGSFVVFAHTAALRPARTTSRRIWRTASSCRGRRVSEARHALDAPWLREAPLARLLAALDRDGEEARVVGGAVRNALLGMPHRRHRHRDHRAAARGDAPRQAAGFKAVPTGIEHGTVTVVAEGRPFEVTTLREDVETFGRHAKVAFGRDWSATPSGATSP